ncbi:antirestriction protein ArdA [Frisingicoccus sp.]|uniref:antirestriction protein ArdA n=1 Tax=Frisingicoccus sp. TaxID=1918627 RepID=UPI00399B65AB
MCNEKAFSAFITNLGKYTEGQLIGKWVDFPTTEKELKKVLQEIGIDRIHYEEVFITDYESKIAGLTDCLGQYENLSMLNFLAYKILESDCSTEQLEALLELGESTGSIEELITLLDNTDCFMMYEDIQNDFDLGYYFIHETGMLQELSATGNVLANYIDYEAFGRDIRLEEGGIYTENYYVCLIESIKPETMEDIQEEYRLCMAA